MRNPVEFQRLFFRDVICATLLALVAHESVLGETASVTAKKPPVKAIKIPDMTIQGQVFIVTKGRTNVRLALVGVSAFPERDILEPTKLSASVERIRAKNSAEIDDLKVVLKEHRQKLAEIEAALSEAYMKADFSSISSISDTKVEGKNISSLTKAKPFAEQVVKTDLSQIARLEQMTKDLYSPMNAVLGLSDPIAVAKTDPDGIFEMTVPAGVYALRAKTSRLAGSVDEEYLWFVRVDATKSNQKIMLSNDNLFETLCVECMRAPRL